MSNEPQAPPPHAVVLQMLTGMWVAQILSAFAQLGIADHLGAGTTSPSQLADACGADPAALVRFLRAAATVGLLAESAEGFSLTPLSATLASAAPRSLRDFVIAETAPGHWLPWGRLADAVRRGGAMARETLGCDPWDYYAANADEGRCFARAMSNLSALAADDVARVYDAVDASGMGARIDLVSGDFFREVPGGGDLYLLKSILHHWPDDKCEEIVRSVHRAAPPRSRLVVVEMLLPDSPQPSPVTLMDMNMLVMLGGRERTAAEYSGLLGRCGYKVERVVPTAGMFSVIDAVRA